MVFDFGNEYRNFEYLVCDVISYHIIERSELWNATLHFKTNFLSSNHNIFCYYHYFLLDEGHPRRSLHS